MPAPESMTPATTLPSGAPPLNTRTVWPGRLALTALVTRLHKRSHSRSASAITTRRVVGRRSRTPALRQAGSVLRATSAKTGARAVGARATGSSLRRISCSSFWLKDSSLFASWKMAPAASFCSAGSTCMLRSMSA